MHETDVEVVHATRREEGPGEANPILSVRDLRKVYPIRRGLLSRVVGEIRAVDGVSFDVQRGETLGLVGESGCGKTTLARVILRLTEATSGEVWFDGQPVLSLDRESMRRLRKRMQIVFQDPYGSLNPRMTVGAMIGEAVRIHRIARGAAVRDRVSELLERVGIPPNHANRYPHEFSGGQRQRIGIARALAVDPDFLILDEPVSALDVSIQAQIINLLRDLQEDLGLTYLFIAHDLSVVQYISDRVAVMYLGRIVEMAPAEALDREALHPYTQALLSSVPSLDPARPSRRVVLPGEVPSPADIPPGCPFHPRCPHATDRCRAERPELRAVSDERTVACFLHEPTS